MDQSQIVQQQSLIFSVAVFEHRKCRLLFRQNRSSLPETCVLNIKIVVIDGVCESILAAILGPAVLTRTPTIEQW